LNVLEVVSISLSRLQVGRSFNCNRHRIVIWTLVLKLSATLYCFKLQISYGYIGL
jgi:hypothetical protein